MTGLQDLLVPVDHDYKKRIAQLFDSISAEQAESFRRGIKTLCEVCGNACGGCEWTEAYVPVPGWDAVRRDVTNKTVWNGKTRCQREESYVVLRCPKFLLEDRWAAWFETWDPEKRRKELKK